MGKLGLLGCGAKHWNDVPKCCGGGSVIHWYRITEEKHIRIEENHCVCLR